MTQSVNREPEQIKRPGPIYSCEAPDLVTRNVIASACIGVIPYTTVHLVAATALQLNMLHRMCRIYEVEFSRERLKIILAALLGGGGTALLTTSTSRLVGMIPGVGRAIKAITAPILLGATTYAIGRVFIMHFESGGTLLSFNPEEMKQHFAEEFAQGKLAAAQAAGAG